MWINYLYQWQNAVRSFVFYVRYIHATTNNWTNEKILRVPLLFSVSYVHMTKNNLTNKKSLRISSILYMLTRKYYP